MNLFQVVVTAVLTTLAVFALTVTGVWALWPEPAQASVSVAAHAGSWHDGTDGHCSRFGSAHIELGEAVISTTLDLNEDQEAALAPVTQAAQRWRTEAQNLCESANFSDVDTSLESVEQALDMGASAMKEMRPLISNFYASLSEEQQAKVQEFVQHRRGHHRRGFGRHGWGR